MKESKIDTNFCFLKFFQNPTNKNRFSFTILHATAPPHSHPCAHRSLAIHWATSWSGSCSQSGLASSPWALPIAHAHSWYRYPSAVYPLGIKHYRSPNQQNSLRQSTTCNDFRNYSNTIQFENTTLKPHVSVIVCLVFASEGSLHIRKAETRFRKWKYKDRSGLKCPLGNAQGCNPSPGNRAVSEDKKSHDTFLIYRLLLSALYKRIVLFETILQISNRG